MDDTMPDEMFVIELHELEGNTRKIINGLQLGVKVYHLGNGPRGDPVYFTTLLGMNVENARRFLGPGNEITDLTKYQITAPMVPQQIWAAGVTYKRSEEAREVESQNSTIYTRVYNAQRPELFFKSVGAVGPGDKVGIRFDAKWSVPEPELVVVLNADMEVVG